MADKMNRGRRWPTTMVEHKDDEGNLRANKLGTDSDGDESKLDPTTMSSTRIQARRPRASLLQIQQSSPARHQQSLASQGRCGSRAAELDTEAKHQDMWRSMWKKSSRA